MTTLISEIYESITINERNFYTDLIYKSSLINFTDNLDYYIPILWQNSRDIEPNYLNFISHINGEIEKFYPHNNNSVESNFIIENLNKIREFLNVNILTLGMEITNNNIKNSLTLNNNTLPEYDFSDNEDKVKLIILEKLGVIDYIKSIQQKPEVISHTAEILSTFTGIKSESLYTYLRPMICNVRDDKDKNSPYNNAENLPKANRQILKLKIIDANK